MDSAANRRLVSRGATVAVNPLVAVQSDIDDSMQPRQVSTQIEQAPRPLEARMRPGYHIEVDNGNTACAGRNRGNRTRQRSLTA